MFFKSNRASSGFKVAKNGSGTDIECIGDFGDGESAVSQLLCPSRGCFGGSLFSSSVNASASCHADTSSLSLLSIFKFDFCETKQNASNHSADRSAKINELRDRHDTHAAFAPIGDNVYTI